MDDLSQRFPIVDGLDDLGIQRFAKMDVISVLKSRHTTDKPKPNAGLERLQFAKVEFEPSAYDLVFEIFCNEVIIIL